MTGTLLIQRDLVIVVVATTSLCETPIDGCHRVASPHLRMESSGPPPLSSRRVECTHALGTARPNADTRYDQYAYRAIRISVEPTSK